MKFSKGKFLLLRITQTKPTLQGTISDRLLKFADCTIFIHSDKDRKKRIKKRARKQLTDIITGKRKAPH